MGSSRILTPAFDSLPTAGVVEYATTTMKTKIDGIIREGFVSFTNESLLIPRF